MTVRRTTWRPRGLRTASLVLVLATLSLAFVIPAQPAARSDRVSFAPGSLIEQSVLSGINRARRVHGLRPLSLAPELARAADSHARSMARVGYFSHSSADGTSAFARIRRFYRGSALGETLLWRAPSLTPGQAVEMWLNSPEHRAILLSAAYTQIGLGAVQAANAPGAYHGLDVTVLVADFGAR